ncbi:unnamed protein product [Tenebrio molitor]|nr:unnamed protein product [Tenebrio molitor]
MTSRPEVSPEVRLMHPQSTVDQLPYQLRKDFTTGIQGFRLERNGSRGGF